MPYLIAENISLDFPVYSGVASSAESDVPDRQMLIGKSGKTIGVRALENISFSLKTGDRLALIGRNGSGKTTLLQVLSQIYPPSKGRVLIEGHATSVINLHLGMQMEASGHENITLRGLAFGFTRKQIEACRDEIVKFANIGNFIDLPVMTYSSGMKMRLNFAIATAFTPDILILDEWLSAGDAAFREAAAARMNAFVGRASIMVLASHSAEMMKQTCNVCLWLDKGTVRAFGNVKDVLNDYLAESRPAAVAVPPPRPKEHLTGTAS